MIEGPEGGKSDPTRALPELARRTLRLIAEVIDTLSIQICGIEMGLSGISCAGRA
jgi:hypothetical protein